MSTVAERTAIAAELERLRRPDGLLYTVDVVDAARDQDSILHGRFMWDDGEAAELYRLGQARALIASIKIPMQLGPALTIDSVAYVSAELGEISAYRSLAEVVPGTDEARNVIVAELARIGGLLRRAKRIAVVLDAEDEIDNLLRAVLRTRKRIETKRLADA